MKLIKGLGGSIIALAFALSLAGCGKQDEAKGSQVAAKVNGDACVDWLGPGSAGHFVKMVHNGIEYAVMQLIAETYDLMKRGLGLNDDELHDVYSTWNTGELNSYLLEIASHIFAKQDEKTGTHLIDEILAVAKQKGTGMWTSQTAPGLMVSLAYLDGFRSAWLPANLIQAQRDYFGAHTYERIDAKGTFHTEWEKN